LRLIFFVFIIFIPVGLYAQVQPFWLQPDKFSYKTGEELKLNFSTGEDFIAEPIDAKISSIEKLELHTLEKITDLKTSFKEGKKDNLSVQLSNEGTYIISLQSAPAFVETESVKFNAYLKDNGLDDALHYREQNHQSDIPGTELFTECAKLIIQTGGKGDATFKKSTGLPLEIFVEKNPCNIKVGEMVRFKVMFRNKPLFGARVMIWNRADNRTTRQPVYTMKDGTIEARISSNGPWLMTVLTAIPSTEKNAAWQVYRGSLMFGI
jgi:uncharacterized GH25 family protein